MLTKLERRIRRANTDIGGVRADDIWYIWLRVDGRRFKVDAGYNRKTAEDTRKHLAVALARLVEENRAQPKAANAELQRATTR